ncbi:MAG TPA: MFS transporter [Kineosporiaceae bacterium]
MHRPGPGSSPARRWPLFAGGFIGPFGGAMVTPMLPELAHGLGSTLATVAWSLTLYLVPFATLMLFSGTLGDRWGRARTIRTAYAAYAVASLTCAVATSSGLFLAGRALQGAANAFTSPLLVAALSDAVRPDRLGRALGAFASWQAAGQAFAPVIGGGFAAVNYRWAFLFSTLAAVGLALLPPPDPGDATGRPAASWAALANRRLAISCAVAFCLYLTTTGVLLLVALRGGDAFTLGPDARGLVVATFGIAGLLAGAALGRLADRFGVHAFGLCCLPALGAGTVAAGVVPDVPLLVLAVAGIGVASTAGRVVVITLAIRSSPANRGGATSMTLAWQFLGAALAPVALLPVYRSHPVPAFALAASVTLPAAALLLIRTGPALTPEPPSTPVADRAGPG